MQFPPILIFTYNRPKHLNLLLNSLFSNPEASDSEVIVIIDGPKNREDETKQLEIKSIIDQHQGFFKKIRVLHRPKNFGLAYSIELGVHETLEEYDRIIVLEDDLIVSPQFLGFMNFYLEKYKSDGRVASIHGYIYPCEGKANTPFFIRGADCWGWGTWKRAWGEYRADGKSLLAELKARNLFRDFDYNGKAGFTKMLEDQANGKNNSWAIRWYTSAFLKDLLTLYPHRTLVQNVGFDGSGTHCDTSDIYYSQFEEIEFDSNLEVKESSKMRVEFEHFYQKLGPKPLWKRILKKIFLFKKQSAA